MTNLLDKLNKLELDQKKAASLGLVCLAVLIFDVAFPMKWQFRAIKNTSAKAAKLKTDLKKINKDLATVKGLKDKQAGQKEAAKSRKLISGDQITALLQAISDIANKNSIKIVQMKPSKEIKGKGEKFSFDTTKFGPLTITLDLVCDYHHLGKFINELENSESFVAVQEIRIIRDTDDYLHQNVNLALKTYVKK
jgi:Tfp pilus assembly protein PilO